MPDKYDKILGSTFTQQGELTWVSTEESDDAEPPNWYRVWLLVQKGTDRVLITIEGPSDKQLCYAACAEIGTRRLFISLEGAQRYGFSLAMKTITDERTTSATCRKSRRESRIRKGTR